MAKRKRSETAAAPSATESAAKSTNESPPPFDEAFAKLRKIVDRLESGSQGLEESLAEFEAGIALLRTCTRILDDADRRIAILTGFDAEGRPCEEPFDATATHEAATNASAPAPMGPRSDDVEDDDDDDARSARIDASTNDSSPREGGSHPARELFR